MLHADLVHHEKRNPLERAVALELRRNPNPPAELHGGATPHGENRPGGHLHTGEHPCHSAGRAGVRVQHRNLGASERRRIDLNGLADNDGVVLRVRKGFSVEDGSLRLLESEVAKAGFEVEHEERGTGSAGKIELAAHEHGALERGTEGSGSRFDYERERVLGIVGSVSDFKRRTRFVESRKVEREFFGFASDDAGLEGHAQNA